MDKLRDLEADMTTEDQKRLEILAPLLDQLGHFPKEAFEIISGNHHFHLFVPEERGGLNYDLIKGMRIIESYARIDGNLGWIVQIGAGGGVFSAYLNEKVAANFFSRPEQVIAGSDFVGGDATTVANGFQVSGEWKYASGALHATAFTANCRIVDGPDQGLVKAVIVPADQVRVIEDWNAVGMRATDSHSFRIDDIFVPEDHTFVVDHGHLLIENRLLKLPFLMYARALFTPVLIGVAHRYLTLFRDFILRRNYQENTPSALSRKNLEQVWNNSRNDLYQLSEEIRTFAEIKDVDGEKENEFARICVRITDDLIMATDQCHRHTGMEGIHMDSQINMAYRNIKTAAAHHLLNQSSLY